MQEHIKRKSKVCKIPSRVSKSASGLVSQTEPNNFLNILGNLNEQTNMLRVQNKQKVSSFIVFPKCRKKHALHECPLDNIKICKICAGSHTTEDFPSLPGLKAAYQKDNGAHQAQDKICYVAPRGRW